MTNDSVGSATSEEGNLFSVIFCVAVFWTFITLNSILCRRLVLYLFGSNGEVVQGAARSVPSLPSFLARAPFSTSQFRKLFLVSILDAIATFELCACSLDCWPFRVTAGRLGLLAAIALNSIRTNVFTYGDAYGNPCNPWYRLLTGQSTQFWVGLTWLLQLLSAQFAYVCAKAWWSLRPTYAHAARYKLAEDPSNLIADLQVPIWKGFLIEAFGTFLEFYLAFLFTCIFAQWNRHYLRCPRTRRAFSSADDDQQIHIIVKREHETSRSQMLTSYCFRLFVSLYVTAQCLSLTGMYMNPANAFAHCWGVQTVSPYMHIIVYWLGPFFGVWLAVQMQLQTVRVVENLLPMSRRISIPPLAPSQPTQGATSSDTHS